MLRKNYAAILVSLILLFSLWIRLDFVADLDIKPISDLADYDQRGLLLAEEGT